MENFEPIKKQIQQFKRLSLVESIDKIINSGEEFLDHTHACSSSSDQQKKYI